MSPLARPPEGLVHFPAFVLAPGAPLFRIHRADRDPWWFSADGSGRFDLEPPRGTCYLAADPLGAFVETFRCTRLIPEQDLRRRACTRLALPRELRLADCAARKARMFGVTAAIHSTPDYALTRAWAAAFAAAGFDGVRYLVSHDPAQALAGCALFGERSARDGERSAGDGEAALRPPGEPVELGPDLLRQAREQFGLLALPSP